MDEHERTVRAAQQVDKMIGFYVHFVVFFFWCAGDLLSSIGLRLPEVWWAEWPFLGWGVAVVFHALCAFSSGPNVVAGWRLRKIRELAAPERAVGASRAASNPAKLFGILLLGMLIGCVAGGGYVYTLLQDARENVRSVQASRDGFEKTIKEQQAQLKQAADEKLSLEGTVKETKDQLGQLQASKQAAEQALKDANEQLKQAQSARDAAERALSEAKKGTPQ